jgi:hypothetical protein
VRLSDFLDDVGRPLAYYPALALCLGNVNATILLCQLFYWDGKQADEEEGWIYKTQAEITEETGLSRRESDTARKFLRKKKIISDRLRGVPPKIHIRIHRKELNDLWDSWRKAPNQNGGKRQIKMAGAAESDGGKRQNDLAGSAELKRTGAPERFGASRHDKYSETTSETTPEITQETTREHTPTPAPPRERRQARAGVGVNSKFTLKERKQWARWKASLPGSEIRDPEALARARGDGQDDEEIEEFLAKRGGDSAAALPLFAGEAAAAPRKPKGADPNCDSCGGTGWAMKGEGRGRGARRCDCRTREDNATKE